MLLQLPSTSWQYVIKYIDQEIMQSPGPSKGVMEGIVVVVLLIWEQTLPTRFACGERLWVLRWLRKVIRYWVVCQCGFCSFHGKDMLLMDVLLWVTEMGRFRVKQGNHLYSFPKSLRNMSQVGKKIADICICLCLYLQSCGAPDSA